MANCECCFTDYLAKCESDITVYANLTPGTSYRWVITSKQSGNKYEGQVDAGEDGELVIPVADLPAGMLNQYAGEFSLQVYDVYGDNCGPLKFKIAKEVDCIDFDIHGGTFRKDELGCLVSPVIPEV